VNYLDQANNCPVKAIEYSVNNGVAPKATGYRIDDRHSIPDTPFPTDTEAYPSPYTMVRGDFSHTEGKVIR
jgi:hypothetical protein